MKVLLFFISFLFSFLIRAQLISIISGNVPGCVGSSVTMQLMYGNTTVKAQWKVNGVYVTTSTIFTTTITDPVKEIVALPYFGGAGDVIALTPKPNPLRSGSITGLTTVCQGQSSVNYTVPVIKNATSYIWVDPNNPLNSITTQTNSININFSNTFLSGKLYVSGANICNQGIQSQELLISSKPLPSKAEIIKGKTIVCEGQNYENYSVTSIPNATSYLWSLPSGASGLSDSNIISVNYNRIATSGNITVKGVNLCGYGPISVLPVIVNPLPTVTATASKTKICNGEEVTLEAFGALTYDWDNNVINNVSFVPTATNTYSVNGTDKNGCSDTATVSVIVNSIPNVIATASKSRICSGENVFLTGFGASTYSWNNDITNGVSFVPTNTKVYTLTGTDNNGCKDTANITVNVINLSTTKIEYTLPAAICTGGSKVLKAPFFEGATYQWKKNGVAIAGAIDSTLIVNSAGAYSLSTSLGSTCKSDAPEVILSLIANPTAGTLTGSNYVCKNSSVKLTPSVPGGTWTSLKPSIASVDAQGNVTGLKRTSFVTGVVSYTVTNASGCSASVVRGLGIDSLPVVPIISGPAKICSGGTAFFRTTNTAGVLWTAGPSLTASSAYQGVFTHRVAANGAVPSDNFNTFVKATSYSVNKVCTSEATRVVQLRTITSKSIAITAANNLVVNANTPVSVTFPSGLTTSNTSSRFWISSASADMSVVSTTNLSTTVKALRVPTVAPKLYFNATEISTGCGMTAFKLFTVSAISLVDASSTLSISKGSIQLYPNPSNGKFTIENNLGATSVKLVDLSGRVIASQSITSGIITVDFSGVAMGKYLVHINGEKINKIEPIVIE